MLLLTIGRRESRDFISDFLRFFRGHDPHDLRAVVFKSYLADNSLKKKRDMSGFPDASAGNPLGNLMQKSDHNIIRDYVMGADHLQYNNVAESDVLVNITHSNLTSAHPDIRINLHTTVENVKARLKLHIGTPVDHQRLILKDCGRVICEMTDNNKKLGFYSVVSGNEIHVIDTDPFSLSKGGGLTDVSLVEKYRMDDETYDKRAGSMREFIRNKRKNDPKYKMKAKTTTMGLKPEDKENFEDMMNREPPPGAESVEGIEIGNRCEVQPGARRGVVKFIGESDALKAGHWVGVQLDEPLGMNDGSINGTVLFECAENHGSMCRGKNITVGDFPEVDPFAELEDSDEEEI